MLQLSLPRSPKVTSCPKSICFQRHRLNKTSYLCDAKDLSRLRNVMRRSLRGRPVSRSLKSSQWTVLMLSLQYHLLSTSPCSPLKGITVCVDLEPTLNVQVSEGTSTQVCKDSLASSFGVPSLHFIHLAYQVKKKLGLLLGSMGHTWSPSTREAEIGESGVQDQLGLPSENDSKIN